MSKYPWMGTGASPEPRGAGLGEWETRLFDYTARNPLLRFSERRAMKIACGDMGKLLRALKAPLLLAADDGSDGGRELERGVLRVLADAHTAEETARRLYLRDRAEVAETGARGLCLAVGILNYRDRDGERRAPLMLVPVELREAREGYLLAAREEPSPNVTLLTYLSRTFHVEAEGDILASMRAAAEKIEGWAVEESAYLAAFSFRRFLLWNDLKEHFSLFAENKNVQTLLSGRAEREEESADAPAPLLPLMADGSQYAAAARAARGESFVLHGPPGTGKSRTIANILANALACGKRVLFVSEKRAALDVVLRRLGEIGLGDFCLELHAGKAEKTAILSKIEQTLSLSAENERTRLGEKEEALRSLSARLAETFEALHRRRASGFSVQEALLRAMELKEVPELPAGEETFYRTLTAEKYSRCRAAIARAAAACASDLAPFAGFELPAYSLALRDRLYGAARVLQEACRHLGASLHIALPLLRHRERSLSLASVENLRDLFLRLSDGTYSAYFADMGEEICDILRADGRLLPLFSYYFKHFSALVDCGFSDPALFEGDWRLVRGAEAAARRLARVAVSEICEEDMPKYLRTLTEIHQTLSELKQTGALSRCFDRGGRFLPEAYERFLRPLRDLHAQCEALFSDFDRETFDEMCVRADRGAMSPVFCRAASAAEEFLAAVREFSACSGLKEEGGEDAVSYFSRKTRETLSNIDGLAARCEVCDALKSLRALGLCNVAAAVEGGETDLGRLLSMWEKHVCTRLLALYVPADPALARLAGGISESAAELSERVEAYCRAAQTYIRETLISRLPAESILLRLQRTEKGVRALFAAETASVLSVCPCVFASPAAVAQYLPPEENFDIAVFDEASQLTAAEAVGAFARAKSVIVAGDRNQLPPASFFLSAGREETESVLDECLAAGMPEFRLNIHYRSRHESLIAFSNERFYGGRLLTVPSPDAEKSRVKLVRTDGVYERGGKKCNRAEAEALVGEIVRRLKDPALCRASMGVVTFSGAQQEEVERLLFAKLKKLGLEKAAYAREEPLFVKNLENVQGDERDVILLSVCYGPDAAGKLYCNFGPLSREDGWRRLNVAVSRAREEMLVFASLCASDIREGFSRGVLGLKAFLQYAEGGGGAAAPSEERGFGAVLARELRRRGYPCRAGVGVSAYRVDVAVYGSDGKTFLAAILADGDLPVTDRLVLLPDMLRRAGWKVIFTSSVAYYMDPARELARITRTLDELTGKKREAPAPRRAAKYRAVAPSPGALPAEEGEIVRRLKQIVAREQPISRAFLKKRCLESLCLPRAGAAALALLDACIDGCNFSRDRVHGVDYFYTDPRAISFESYRTEGRSGMRREAEDFTVYEVVAFVRDCLERGAEPYVDELADLFAERCGGDAETLRAFVESCVDYGVEKGAFARTKADRVVPA